jgi:hypothetical protein
VYTNRRRHVSIQERREFIVLVRYVHDFLLDPVDLEVNLFMYVLHSFKVCALAVDKLTTDIKNQ